MKILLLQFVTGFAFGCAVGTLLMHFLYSRRLYRPAQLKEAFQHGYYVGAASALLRLKQDLDKAIKEEIT